MGLTLFVILADAILKSTHNRVIWLWTSFSKIDYINGVKIIDSEFLLSQYADDSSLVLEDDPQSLDNSIKLVHKFTECAGLRINIDKTNL
jgi:hypothetical protein